MSKTVLGDVREVKLAVELITLGARLQFLEAEVSLSRERLIKLYKELKGVSPPKGLLPYATEWYTTWLANIHSSMFYNIYRFMVDQAREEKLGATIKAYRMYLEQVAAAEGEAVLDFTRAAMLVKFFDSGMLELAPCTRCAGLFVGHAHDTRKGYVCVLCRPPSRAGRGKTPKAATIHAPAQATSLLSYASPFPVDAHPFLQ
jgi:flagellar transcriptional activator FlhC